MGTKQLKKNAVTAAKIKKNAVTTATVRNSAIATAKIKDGAVTGTKVNAATLGTVPSSATTEEVKGSKGVLGIGQQATIFEHGPVKLIASCETYEATKITARVYIESSAEGTTFVSWEDSSKAIGPATPITEREVTDPNWARSSGPIAAEAGAPVSATAASGPSFSGTMAVASEKDSSTCWYWFHATIVS